MREDEETGLCSCNCSGFSFSYKYKDAFYLELAILFPYQMHFSWEIASFWVIVRWCSVAAKTSTLYTVVCLHFSDSFQFAYCR